ncbi:hypothetical protein [Nonomuraea jiangxiensis]|uniref:hypothetical protein n=1 Tax=Nonomuraea jiangxiensis TaxID=633440 RepID=UPI000B83DE39|nr:hypothetical protein [Nonomuraea jiangxiensis]
MRPVARSLRRVDVAAAPRLRRVDVVAPHRLRRVDVAAVPQAQGTSRGAWRTSATRSRVTG